MPNWPTDLPFFRRSDGFARTGPQESKLRTSMSHGPVKMRRLTSAATKRLTGSTPYLSDDQVAEFEEFFDTTLSEGVLSFDAEDPVDGVLKSFRFIESYTIEPVGPFWQISADLEILP